MKRFTFLCAAMVFAVVAFAQLSIWNGSSDIWTKGAGTEASPYLIESAEQLAFIAEMVNGGVTTYENTYFKLMTNIDLNNQTWVPIGASEERAFSGHIDGNNYMIFGVLNKPLLNVFVNGSIYRLNVEMNNGFINIVSGCSIKNCFYKGNNTMVQTAVDAFFTECVSITDISESMQKGNYISGVVNIATNCKFTSCKAFGNILGGLNEYITDWYWYSRAYDYNLVACNIVAAGVVALSENCQYSQCSWNGDITVSGAINRNMNLDGESWRVSAYNFAGGIVGLSVKDSIKNSQVLGDLKSNKHEASWGCGSAGIIGIQSDYQKMISQLSNSFTSDSACYFQAQGAYFAPLDNKLAGGKRFGSSPGTTGTPVVNNCYSRTDKTEAAMKSASFPIILNTDSTVFIQDTYGVNDGYPIYKEQVYSITSSATEIGLTSAILNGKYYALNADSIGFEYKELADKTHWYKRVTTDATTSEVSYMMDNLETGTQYVYRLWVARDGVFFYGDTSTFTTQECSATAIPITVNICKGEEYDFNDRTLTASGVYYDTLTAINGCDSIIELTLNVSPVNEIQKYDTINVGESYDFYGNILTETGRYFHYVPAGSYCNLVILNLYVKQPSVIVSVQSSNPALGIVTGGGTYEKYTPVTLTAIPNKGCRFVKWTDGNTDNPRVIIPESDCTYIAEFEETNYTLNLAANDDAMGHVFGAGTYKYGTEVAINAIPNTGYQFTQWSDNDTNASRTIIITSDLSLTAYFQPIKYTIIATANDETLGTVYGSGEYAYNTSVSLMAVPQNGCEFITWSNGVNSNPYTFVAVDNVTLQAIFRATSSGVEDVDVDANTPIQKILRDGQLLIIHDGKTYNVMGQEL